MDIPLFPVSRRECEGALLSCQAAARSVLEQTERAVIQARRAGLSWERIGANLGRTGEWARKHYGGHEDLMPKVG